jgi:hypothetical protein
VKLFPSGVAKTHLHWLAEVGTAPLSVARKGQFSLRAIVPGQIRACEAAISGLLAGCCAICGQAPSFENPSKVSAGFTLACLDFY